MVCLLVLAEKIIITNVLYIGFPGIRGPPGDRVSF